MHDLSEAVMQQLFASVDVCTRRTAVCCCLDSACKHLCADELQAFQSLPDQLCKQLAGSMTHIHLPAGPHPLLPSSTSPHFAASVPSVLNYACTASGFALM